MKVYELMNELSKMPAGAIVNISMVKDDNELQVFEETDDVISYGINFEVRSIEKDGDTVCIDAW